MTQPAISSSPRPARRSPGIRIHEIFVLLLAAAVVIQQLWTVWAASDANIPTLTTWIWGIAAGSQILLTKYLRVPIAPGKWYDFSYVPIWVVAFTVPAPYALLILAAYSVLVYVLFPSQFYCRRTVWSYIFHFSYQVVLLFATIQCFWLVQNYLSWSVNELSLTSTVAMFASMFGLMFTDTLLGGWIQTREGQHNVWTEWGKDYLRITVVQTLLSSIAMLFAVLYMTGHPFQLAAVYGFFLLGLITMYRASFRQDDYIGLVRSMINMVELKDTYTKNHSESVGHYSVILGQMLGLPASRLDRLRIAAQLHDVGKIGIPDGVLKKEGPLTDEEYEVMKGHAAYGEKVLQPILSLHQEAVIIGRHHEHVNGGGYPYRIQSGEIPLESRIIGIADAYHAMISNRPYRKGLDREEAMRRLIQGKDKQFDPALVDLFCEYIKDPLQHTYRFRPFCIVH